MHAATPFVIAAFGAGLVATLVLAAWLTPRAWWRRANARALAVLAVGTLAIGAMLLWLFGPPQRAVAAMLTPIPLQAHGTYTVYRDLNLRASSGVSSRRLAVVPAGASITFTGLRDGDWWQVRAQVDGREVRGWASSLWLRRSDEGGVGDRATVAVPSD